MNQKIRHTGELSWLLAVILCSLSVCFSANSGFGVSMVVAPAYILHLEISRFLPWFTFGMSEYCLQGLLVIVCCVMMGRFKWKYPLAFGTAVCYGLCLDFFRLLLGTEVYPLLWQRCLSCAAGMLICAFSIALFLRSYLPQQAYELMVKELTTKTGADMHKVKWIYDISSLLVAIVLMLLFFRRFSFDQIGIGTLLVTVLNTPLIALAGRVLDRYVSFDPAFPRFHDWFERNLD